MSQDRKNRILGRMHARELTPSEADIVNGRGQVATTTVCTIGSNGVPDGDVDLGECAG